MRPHIDSARRLGTIVAVIVVTALAASACGDKKGPDIISASETYIPDFNRTWANRTSATHTFNFNTNPDPGRSNAGQFVPNSEERLEGNVNPMAGSYNGRDLTLRITRPAEVVNVTGRFVTDNHIQLTFPNNVTVNLDRIFQ